MGKGQRRRVKPLLPIFGTWFQGYKYPTFVHIPMMDGHVVRYDRRMEVVPVNVGKGGWKKGRYMMVGYQYKK